MKQRNILLCGHRSFAAKGLVDKLNENNFFLTTFSRGSVAKSGTDVLGPVGQMLDNPYLEDSYDIVINYILLKQESIEQNRRYMEVLLKFCEDRSVKHFIHISSCSVYKNNARHVDENTPIETNPGKKGIYGAIKAAQEDVIFHNRPPGLKVSIVRPGLILANGMGGFIGGIAIRLPWNSVVGLGNSKSQLPLVTRRTANDCVVQLVKSPPQEDIEVLLLADSKSPTRRQYVENCRDVLGGGTKVKFFPVFLWKTAAFCGEILSRLIGKGRFGIYGKVSSVCRFQRFYPEQTEKRLGISFSEDWKKELFRAFDCQEPDFKSYEATPLKDKVLSNKINYIGFGRIVKQRHLPALKKIGFNGEIKAYDLISRDDESGIQVASIQDSVPDFADLTVICTPGPNHVEAIEILQDTEGSILVEKPLCYTRDEFEQWLRFAQNRTCPVYCCHDKRYKANVLKMLSHLRTYNPGKLHHVSVHFQSGPVNQESVSWLRNERSSRTLLMDYGVHLIDLACMFAQGRSRLEYCRYELNRQGETSLIEGQAAFENHSIHFLFRQGINQRKCRLLFVFQNYSVSLGFAPDIFVPHMADDNFGLSWIETRQALKVTRAKVTDYLLGRNSEDSHAHVLHDALLSKRGHPLNIENLKQTYDLLFQISDSVYDRYLPITTLRMCKVS